MTYVSKIIGIGALLLTVAVGISETAHADRLKDLTCLLYTSPSPRD